MSTMTVPFSERRGRYRLACGCEYAGTEGLALARCGIHPFGEFSAWHAARKANAPITLLDEVPKPLAVGDVVVASAIPVGARFVSTRPGSGEAALCDAPNHCLDGTDRFPVDIDLDDMSGAIWRIVALPESRDAPVPVVPTVAPTVTPQYRPLFGGVALNRGFPTLQPDECAAGIEHEAPGYAVGDGCTTNHQALDDRIAEITGTSPWRAKFRITQDPWRMR